MKNLIIAAALLLSVSASAQNASSASQQTVQLALSNAIEVTFTGSGTTTGSTVNMGFTSANDYANGVESAQQELKIRSNKNFNVGVKIDFNSFSYTGPGTINPATVPMTAFGLKVAANTTGGTLAAPFSTTGYSTVTGTHQNVISNGTNGGDQKFAVKYKCTPGFNLPAGTYNFAVVYTATQQ